MCYRDSLPWFYDVLDEIALYFMYFIALWTHCCGFIHDIIWKSDLSEIMYN